MKIVSLFLLCLTLLGCGTVKKPTTIILFRHAEKDISLQNQVNMAQNPPLSKAGEARAIKLVEALNGFAPDIIYSSNFIRTKATVTPLAQKLKLDIEGYDNNDLPSFAEKLLGQDGRTIIVSGHSNTTPALVNLLIKENKFPQIPDSVYNKIFVVTITGDKREVKEMVY